MGMEKISASSEGFASRVVRGERSQERMDCDHPIISSIGIDWCLSE